MRRLAENLRDSTEHPHALYFVVEDWDQESIDEVKKLEAEGLANLIVTNLQHITKSVNLGFKSTTEPFFYCTGDDVEFKPGWLENAMKCFEQPGTHVVATWDGIYERGKSGYIVRRSYIEQFGTIDEPGVLLHEGYSHTYADTELLDTSIARGVFAFCQAAHVHHHHYTVSDRYGNGPDRTSLRMAQVHAGPDFETYEKRKGMFNGKNRIDIPFQ